MLLVEDEPRFAESLRRGLAGDGFAVDVVHDGASALTFLESAVYEIVLLDRDLPILHGDIVARTLRDRRSPVWVLMLTAAGDTEDQIVGLELGADDYLAKPFDYDVLLARLRAVVRRRQGGSGGYEFGGIRVEPESRRVWCGAEEVRLRPKEFQVLTELLRARGTVVSPAALYDLVWGDAEGTDEAVVKTVVHSLRKKLGPDRIETVHGSGYRIAA
ncbi:response regulator transcription factor [Micromonospora sp. NBC_01655]|uniref:response regulator transcription factor n=1 Tax=Micromonospora sp. NBC_01655 TaxID=2975983 RepID=UPI00224EA83D|nr:response regulator transcription factor [Micromonospora sp. NBC_01655]MCX4471349.1 response regulator transcription factor [Micromonospora sp. NBC_01655]